MDQENRANGEIVLEEGTNVLDASLPKPEEREEEKKVLWEEPGYWKTQWKRLKKHRRILWFIIPAAIFTLIFSYIPMVGIFYSFNL